MSELAEKLFATADRLDELVKRAESSAIAKLLQKVRDSANEVGRAWSGGWLGYHSRVYYTNFQPVPAGAHFSKSTWLGPPDMNRKMTARARGA